MNSHGSCGGASPQMMSKVPQLLESPVPHPHCTTHVIGSLHLTIPLAIPI
ncbi:hypothetical protein [Chryseobacterium sp.]|nr:hypothetical protein [Chryseobacterium sp.]